MDQQFKTFRKTQKACVCMYAACMLCMCMAGAVMNTNIPQNKKMHESGTMDNKESGGNPFTQTTSLTHLHCEKETTRFNLKSKDNCHANVRYTITFRDQNWKQIPSKGELQISSVTRLAIISQQGSAGASDAMRPW